MNLLNNTITNINPLDTKAMQQAKERLNSLTKPVGSLGIIEQIAIQLAGIQGSVDIDVSKKAVLVCAADHGVVEEGISVFNQETTRLMVKNFLIGGAAINALSRVSEAKVVVADIGVNGPLFEHPNMINLRVKDGTDNFTQGPAMTREEAVASLEAGITMAQQQVDSGSKVLATGEMGIGNTTASSAIIAAVSGLSPEIVTGRGTGIDDKELAVKHQVVAKALAVNNPNQVDGLDILAKVGGLEIGAMAGMIIGGASLKVPVVIDGFISSAAALLAYKIAPACREYIIASHLSEEPGHQLMLEMLDLEPMLHLNMRLGEGTGAVMAFPILEAAEKVMKEMITFEELAKH